MPRGDKSSYSSKQKRQAAHIEKSYEARGLSSKTAEERAWRTVNKQSGGAKGRTRTTGSKRQKRSRTTRSTERKSRR